MTENAQNADSRRKPQIFADSPLLLEIQAFGGCRKPQKTADFRRKPKIFAENRRKPQIGLCHLRCVTFSSALVSNCGKQEQLRQCPTNSVSDLWRRRADLDDTLRHQWFRNPLRDNPTQPDSYHGHGEWLHRLPGKWATTLLDPIFRLGLCQRLGYPAPGAGQRCGRTPWGGKLCTHILDPYG